MLAAWCLAASSAMAQTGTYDVDINNAQYFSVAVPDGNYKVTVTLGSKKRKAETVVRAESRRTVCRLLLHRQQAVAALPHGHRQGSPRGDGAPERP